MHHLFIESRYDTKLYLQASRAALAPWVVLEESLLNSMAMIGCWWKVSGMGLSLMREPLPAAPSDVGPG